ncbi:kelch repeat and BTB domain-containing protein 8-like [Amphiura filiformis]|uniref:kelch repeat and BTB domain-containing protein 8-like n=1 Tax=Amphiura filiformis TaxID=82378 RepID=UPI003B20D3E2
MAGYDPGIATSNHARYSDRNHSNLLLESLSQLRAHQTLTDVTVRVGRKDFTCHRNVLAACSPYFKAMFTAGMQEVKQAVVSLQEVDPKSIGYILDFMYTGNLHLDNDCVQSVFVAANLLQVAPAIHLCAEYLERCLDIANCLGIYKLAVFYQCSTLAESAWDFINYNFVSVCQEDEFLQVSAETLVDLTKSQDLNIDKEDAMFEAVMRWVSADRDGRSIHIEQLLRDIHLELVDKALLWRALAQDVFDQAPAECRSRLERLASQHSSVPCLDGDSGGKGVQRLGMTAQESILLFGRRGREYALLSVELPSKRYQFMDIPAVCRTLGAKMAVTPTNDIYLATDDYKDKTVFRYNHIRRRWAEVAPMLQGRADFGLVHLNGCLYAIGGMNDWEILKSVECYDIAKDEWHFIDPMPRDVIEFSVATLTNSLYIFAGSRTMSYSTTTKTWKPVMPAMPSPRIRVACVTYGTEIWTIGGLSASPLSQDVADVPCCGVEAFAPLSQRWSIRGSLPSLIKFGSAVKYKSKVYLCGMWCGVHELGLGIPMQLNPQFDLYEFNESNERWEDIRFDMPMEEVHSCDVAKIFLGDRVADGS